MNKDEIMNEIVEYYESVNQPKGEFLEGDITYRDIETSLHIGREAAKKMMEKLIADGKFTRHMVYHNKAMRVVFRKVI